MASFDALADPHTCSGTWRGHYRHDSAMLSDGTYPIRATLRQVATRVEGEMSDGLTEFARGLRKVVSAQRGGMSWLSSLVFSRMLRRHPDAVVESRLPAESVVRGRLRGDILWFTKTYLGTYAFRFRDRGGTFASVGRAGHRVHYSGVFDPAQGVIEGIWAIRRRGLFGWLQRPGDTGTFYLARVEG
jgi:hypothetical protein